MKALQRSELGPMVQLTCSKSRGEQTLQLLQPLTMFSMSEQAHEVA